MNYRAMAAAAIAAIIGGGLLLYKTPELPAENAEKNLEKPVQQARGFGIVDMEKIKAAHPDGERLDELRAKELRLRLELNEAMKVVEVPRSSPPETNTEVFDKAAWEKNAQIVISQLAELESKKKLAAEEYRKKSEPRYIEERDRVNADFLNENLNIQLKLKNADHLHLSQEQINELLKRLDEVEIERNQAQRQLLEKWMAEIKQYANESVAAEEARLKAKAEKLRAEVEAQARQTESDVTERNRQTMEEALREMEARQIRRRELFAELRETGNERAELEKKILESIVDKATMLAAVNRLEMIFVKRKPEPEKKFSLRHIRWNFELKEPAGVGAVIIPGKDTRDLTDDLIKEMQRL